MTKNLKPVKRQSSRFVLKGLNQEYFSPSPELKMRKETRPSEHSEFGKGLNESPDFGNIISKVTIIKDPKFGPKMKMRSERNIDFIIKSQETVVP